MTNKKLRQKARKNKNQSDVNVNHENLVEDKSDILVEKPLKQLGDLSRTTEKKTKDKVRKNNREDKFISLGL
jgi:hypothetical protein